MRLVHKRIPSLCLLLPLPALAHGGLETASPVLAGAIHVLLSPLAWAAIAGLVLVVAGSQPGWLHRAWAAVAIGCVAGAMLEPHLSAIAAPAGIALLGACALLALRMPDWGTVVVALLGGAAAGLAAELDTVTVGGLLGAARSAK